MGSMRWAKLAVLMRPLCLRLHLSVCSVDGGASEEDSQGVYAVLTLLAAMVEAQP